MSPHSGHTPTKAGSPLPTRTLKRTSSECSPSVSVDSDLQLTSSTKPDPEESLKKRPRTISNIAPTPTTTPARKSVTIILKNLPSEEFQVAPTAKNSISKGQSTPNNEMALKNRKSKIGNPTHMKVIKVIDFLRNQRKRPKESLVISQAEKMYDLSPETTKAALAAMVKEERIFSVECKNTISYRYHMGFVARGDNPSPKQVSQIKVKYADNRNNQNGVNRKLPLPPPSTKLTKVQPAVTLTQRPIASLFTESSSSSDVYRGPQLTNSEYALLKSFLRIISPINRQVGPSVGEVTKSLADKIRALIPFEDGQTAKPGVSVYVLPPPVNVDLQKLEKSLECLPHRVLNVDSNGDSVSSVSSLTSSRCAGEETNNHTEAIPSCSPETYDYKSILVKRNHSEGFTQLWIRSPGSALRNAFTMQVLLELTEELKYASDDESVRVVVLSGGGQVFSSGIDLPSLLLSVADNQSAAEQWADALRAFLLTLTRCPKLVIAGVNGSAEGLGTTLLPLCDLVYGSDTASFHVGYTSMGQTPEGGASYSLASMIGLPLANDILLAGRRLSAREALQRGLLSDLLFPKNFSRELELRASRLAAASENRSSLARETSKCLIRLQNQERIEFTIDAECRKLAEVWKTTEFQWSANRYMRNSMNDFM